MVGEAGEVETIEHVLSAVRGMQIDNIDIEIDVAEVPHADGSSLPFVHLLKEAGLKDQG